MKINPYWPTLSYLCLGSFALLSDQALKLWVEGNIPLNQSRPLGSQNFLELTSLANSGLLWQNFSGLHPGQVEPYIRYYPTLLLAVFTVLFWGIRSRTASITEKIGFALFFSGGCSNLLSHWKSYFATDTLRIYLGMGRTLPFNLADLWITLGLGLLLFSMFRELLYSFQERSCQQTFPLR
jgi:lipoprotein signal peptidase